MIPQCYTSNSFPFNNKQVTKIFDLPDMNGDGKPERLVEIVDRGSVNNNADQYCKVLPRFETYQTVLFSSNEKFVESHQAAFNINNWFLVRQQDSVLYKDVEYAVVSVSHTDLEASFVSDPDVVKGLEVYFLLQNTCGGLSSNAISVSLTDLKKFGAPLLK